MRLTVNIDGLTPEQWVKAQQILRSEYDIPDGASRVCLTLVYGAEERHVETPVSALTGLLLTMTLTPAIRALADTVRMTRAIPTLDNDSLLRDWDSDA